MTTGEKIAKLRKENNLTQEEFGDLLGVTRQSVSKWESDLSFPETEKLILIGKQFNCSLDYLLNNEYGMQINGNKKENKIIKGNLVDAIALMAYPVLLLICYLLPFARIKTTFPQIGGGIGQVLYIGANFYQFVFSTSYEIGNVIFLVHFLCTILMLGVGVLLLFYNDKRIYKTNFILTIISLIVIVFLSVLVVFGYESPISGGIVVILTLNAVNFILILKTRKKKSKKSKEYK